MKIVALYIGIVVGVLLIAAGAFALKVLVSGPKGAGDVIIKQNDATNRIFAQQHFHELYADVVAYDQQLDQAAADKAEFPDSQFFATNYSGLVKSCIDARNQYNADAEKVTLEKWLDDDLPFKIVEDDPKTDCVETK